jgi:hypothetical protein
VIFEIFVQRCFGKFASDGRLGLLNRTPSPGNLQDRHFNMLGECEAKIQLEIGIGRNFLDNTHAEKICGLGQPPRPHLLT